MTFNNCTICGFVPPDVKTTARATRITCPSCDCGVQARTEKDATLAWNFMNRAPDGGQIFKERHALKQLLHLRLPLGNTVLDMLAELASVASNSDAQRVEQLVCDLQLTRD